MTEILTIDALIRSMGVSTPCRHMLLLGAGASVSSGVASAWDCVWRWKRDMFLSAHPDVAPALLGDATLPYVQRKVQTWIDAGGLGPTPDNDEYSYYAERCYPREEDRRRYFEGLVGDAVPGTGYRVLGLAIEAGHFSWIWTPNFDDLVVRGRPSPPQRIVRQVSLDAAARIDQIESTDRALAVVSLHGDYRYDRLRNTTSELRALDDRLRTRLIDECRTRPLVVVGYSGRDDSIMSALSEAFSRAGGGALYWLTLPNVRPNERVLQLVEAARRSGRTAEIVECDGFDRFMVSLGRYLLRDGEYARMLDDVLRASHAERSAFDWSRYREGAELLKSNSWQIDIPEFIYELDGDGIDGWSALDDLVSSSSGRVCAGLHRGHVVALGARGDIERCFGDPRARTIKRVPVGPADVRQEGVVLGVMRDAIITSLASESGVDVLRTGRRRTLVDRASVITHAARAGAFKVFRAVEVRLEPRANHVYLSLIPDRHVEPPPTASADAAKEVRLEQLVRQYNAQFSEELNSWRKKLRFATQRDITFPPREDGGFVFTVRRGPVFTALARPGTGAAGPSDSVRPLLRYRAFQLPEPALLFHGGQDVHPMRGLERLGPVELSAGDVARNVRVAVVCPTGIEREMHRFLAELSAPRAAIETKQDYLLPYPGFEGAFRVGISIAQPGSEQWGRLADAPDAASDVERLNELVERLAREVQRVAAAGGADVVVVCVPEQWRSFERIEDEHVELDLHDQLKAICALRGIRTQFVRVATVRKRQRSEVLWWLALALYVKSFRTPWLLAQHDHDVAYVGIGYALSRTAKSEGRVLLGCSHVFQANGLGLRFQLTPVKNPLFRGKNPFLQKDDALTIGLQTRELVYQSLQRLPRRVLVSKRTPFRREEIEGILAGLDGVSSVDLVSVESEGAWRYVAQGKSASEPARYPVRRGTVVGVDARSFLLWVHGRVEALDPSGRPYFQGKTRIPAPLRVQRFAGSSPAEKIASDLLRLSKMDWNTFDLYETMPAHLTTSSRVARIGRYLARFGGTPLDYRFFM